MRNLIKFKPPSSMLLTIVVSFFTLTSHANTNFSDKTQDLLIAPNCFLENNSFDYTELAINQSQDRVLFAVDRTYWWQQLNYIEHKKDCGKFINVNFDWQEYLYNKKLNSPRVSDRVSVLDYDYFLNDFITSKSLTQATFDATEPKKLINQELINKLFSEVNQDRIAANLKDFSNQHLNRAAFSDYGVQASDYLKNKLDQLGELKAQGSASFDVNQVATGGWYEQKSIVAILGKDLPGPALVIGAHMDTNGGGKRPGSDDDGSGSMVLMELVHILLAQDFKLQKPIYFIWYAAEEVGLIGSNRVIRQFKNQDINVEAVLNLDTIGKRASPEDNTMWFLTDNVNKNFTDYLANIAKDILKVPVDYTTCGYKCSDHANWDTHGYVAAATIESSFDDINPHIHSAEDTTDHVSFEQLVDHTKLSLAFIVDKAA